MGSECRGEATQATFSKLTVVTLNYCGLSASPFEFYLNEYEHQLKTIGNYFEQLIQKELHDFFKGKSIFGQVQKKFKRRYSPMFQVMAGIAQNVDAKAGERAYRFMTQVQFENEWDKQFERYKATQKSFKKACDDSKNLQNQKRNVRTYDFLMFRALLRYVYKKKNFTEILEEDPSRYIRILQPLFELSFLDEANKISKFQYGFRKTNPDVYFVQETSKELRQFLENRAKRNYRWIADDNGQLIIIKHQTFKHETFEVVDLDIQFSNAGKAPQSKDIYKPIAMGSKSKLFLFVSLHFSSRQKQNPGQMKYLNDLLEAIKSSKIFKTVILGGNLNKFQNKFPQGYDFFPKKPTQITTFKKRTKTQGQYIKNDLRDKKSIDKIITNQTIVQSEITLIDGTKPDEYGPDQKEKFDQKKLQQQKIKCGQGLQSKIKMLLPCDIHPFDKFLIKTIITVPLIENSKEISIHDPSKPKAEPKHK